ncbi:hypothetical protein GHT06_010937 [Daphnia sinensis]|uniref:F-box domain-containing protein n=1 Tax=Daphnia sinensis TaxID=1820382 RepID=A0AAD5Q0W4_9CRUS|nr:hypothetical protein GHT06_010937 [Daphnia sinensis]
MDIIYNLQRRKLLEEIAVEIFQYLDVNDLHAAEKVSPVWKETVINGKLWEKLFKRNVVLHPPWKKMNSIIRKQQSNSEIALSVEEEDEDQVLWSEQEFFRTTCLTIADSLDILDKNWMTGNYQEEIVLRGAVIGPVNSITFLMDEKHIVRHVDSERTFQFFNRWSLDLEESIPSRTDFTGNQHHHCFVTCFDFSDELLVVGYGNGVVDVIWRKTRETLHTFRDFDWPNNHSVDGDDQDNYVTEKVILSPQRQFLLSYLYTTTSYFLTLRKISDVKDMKIAHQLQLDENVEELVNLYMDDLYTVLFIRSRTGRGPSEEIFEVRSTDSFTPLHSFSVQGVVSAYHYLDGLLVIGTQVSNSQFLRVWNTKTGNSVWDVNLDREKIVDLRIISDKYIVSVNGTGELKQWDLHTVLDHAVPADKALLHRIGSTENLSSCVGGGMVADEYQVVLFGFFRTTPIKGHESPIIVSLDFMKGQNHVKKPLPQLY